ncbi:mitoguardin 1 isoform X2 [Salvelinus fontinalis]|uniref:mitoguardin 1 isoform X2 n=1 Tax=Salvelinus fontinalis TaxID=8038 RepID=UPI0024862F71|nr:mitoguardin 1 isoform X2 [Salvelinus fontinalis]
MTDDAFTGPSTKLSFHLAAIRVVNLPHTLYNSLSQVSVSTGTKKVVAATAFGAVSLLFLARHFQRRKGRKKGAQSPQWEQTGTFQFPGLVVHQEKDASSCQNLSLSLNCKNVYACGLLPNEGPYSKLSVSLQSLASVKSINSSCTCANSSACWDRPGDEDISNVVNIPVTTPQILYLRGMELFEEALRRWEQALTFSGRPGEEEPECSSFTLGAGDSTAEESIEDLISAEFVHKLELLLQSAYRLQEEFEGALGVSEPSSHSGSHDKTRVFCRDDLDDVSCLKDSISIASNDSFMSAAELSEQYRELRSAHVPGSCIVVNPFYEEAIQLAEEGKISCRVHRTELLECLGDTDFLAKLHCVRQACQLILCERATRTFLSDTGKKILSSIIVKARKSPKRFEEVFEEMIVFLEHPEHWENTEVELATRGVKHLNFYDIVLDFILMDSFEDLENPPISIQNVVNNRWLNSSFKETAVASSCWSVLKQKRQHMRVSPVLAWGFLGPKTSLHDFCCFFKDQVLFFLKDVFDLEKVRYCSVETLAEDMLHLLHRRSELLLAYLGADSHSLQHINSCTATALSTTASPQPHPSALEEAVGSQIYP